MIRFIRYSVIIFPILCLTVVLNYTHANKFSVATYAAPHSNGSTLQSITPQKMNERLAIEGPYQTIKKIEQNHQWQYIFQQINLGNQQWIEITSQLIPYVDNSLKAKFNHALIQALAKNPQAVLKVLTLNNISADNTNQICKAQHFTQSKRQSLINALQAIHSISLIYQQQNCLQQLQNMHSAKLS
ncbi:hypothetical protein [Commensalibacter oyaizuii]|uniref:Uncharacterized protein n=1 Tax=Commensalibacter oyaizuii TaxID=3043873 RepID=A0ABT6Q1R9_9PROT|nr:hypothetical protein [Commensalibacter sp. TBRC 16381]MDI2091057.1 hypothetical protein [Commensalibacter sp. TBRC 16381]